MWRSSIQARVWRTPFTRRYRLRCPFVGAGMAMIAGPALAAAVSEAGGLGQLGVGPMPPPLLRQAIQDTRALTSRPFAVNLIVETTGFGPATTGGHIDVCAREKVPVVVFFWNAPGREWLDRLRAAGCRVWASIATAEEMDAVRGLPLDAVIVQGREAGGHIRAVEGLHHLIARARERLGPMPLIAAGGIGSERTAAAAFIAGASAVCVGTRLVASRESAAHPDYKARLIAAQGSDTLVTELFGPEWPGAPMRVLANRAARGGSAGASPIGRTTVFGQPYEMPMHSAILPTVHASGNLDDMCLPAGEGVGAVRAVQSAAEIVREIMDGARKLLDNASTLI
jgi:NAD(P)H-dependent flavin oxidoreductase YrpB (nitropropane dioxygenase family)